jgi:outer membrane receptor protein involved in Fe transport
MKNTKVIYLSFLLLTLLGYKPPLLFAQTPKPHIKIQGVVLDSMSKAPLALLTVDMVSLQDSLRQSTQTKLDGSFNLTGMLPSTYLLRIRGLGFAGKTITVNVDHNINLGTIYLASLIKSLKTVNVIATKPLIRQEVDRITYDLQADPQSKVSSVLEMMRKVPYLSVDGDENILLNGSSGYRIFINGKPSGMVERNPKDILRSMPASTIKSIQVITSPSSKYDSEGLAGIINIITIKQIDNGYNGSLNINERGPAGGPGAGSTLTYREGKIVVTALAGASVYNLPETKGYTARTTTGDSATYLNQTAMANSKKHTGYAGVEISYDVDSLHLISAQFNWNTSKSKGLTEQETQLTGAGELLQQYNLVNHSESSGNGIDAAINYQLGFKANKDQTLTLSYRYLNSSNTGFNRLNITNHFHYLFPDYNQSNNEGLSEHTFQADYVQPLKQVTVEAGIKGIFRQNNSDFRYNNLNPVTLLFDLDEMRSNVFNNEQNVLAVYNTYGYHAGSWQVKAGIRAEETIIKGEYTEGNSAVSQKYLNVIPSAVINRKFTNGSSLNLSYSKRIRRPAISQLNPFIDRSNPNFAITGNPGLRPTTSDAIQLTYFKSAKYTLNIVLGYLFFKSLINPLSTFNQATDVTLVRFENTGKGSVLKTNIYISYPVTGKWSINLNSDLRYVTSYAAINNSGLHNSGFMAYVNLSSGYRFNKGWRINADCTYNSGGVSGPQAKINGSTAATVSVNKDIIKNKLTLSGAVNNPFSKFRYNKETTVGPNFIQQTDNQVYYRSVVVSLNYRFGKLKDQIRKNRKGINNDDLSK